MPLSKRIVRLMPLITVVWAVGCLSGFEACAQIKKSAVSSTSENHQLNGITSQGIKMLLESALDQTTVTKSYDPAYVRISYPMGDVPPEKGVCSDVVIRAFREAGVDLQKTVHEDMKRNFSVYPQKWSLKKPDANIDHRRVPNLQTFFKRQGKSLPITDKAENYKPGDVVAWDLNGRGLTHIGLVSNLYNETTKQYSIIHNIGRGAQAEDVIFNWKIIGHYRYF